MMFRWYKLHPQTYPSPSKFKPTMETHNVVSTNEEAFPKLPTATYICSGSAEQHTTQSQSSSQTVWFTKGPSSLVQGCSNHVPQKPTAPT